MAAMSPSPSLPTSPGLTPDELARIDANPWYASLSAALREDMLARAVVRRVRHGTLLASRGQPAQEWFGIAKGAVRVSSVSPSGRQITLTYARTGVWLGDISLVDGLPRSHDANAQDDTTLAVLRKQDFKELQAAYPELSEALLLLNCRRLRTMFDQVESFATLPLAARLAKQLLELAHGFGKTEGDEIRIGLHLAQEELAQLLGASRQRVNRELKNFERQGALRVEPTRLVVLSKDQLLASITSPT